MKGQNWEDYERAADRGPGHIAVKVIVLLFALGALIGGIGYVFGWFGEAAKVAQDEFGPRAMLDKYTLLKDMHAQLDKKKADIQVGEQRLTSMKEAYAGVPRGQWPRDEREAYNQKEAELAGMKLSYNDLAAQYNAKMAEVHYRFANVGELPQGATEPLPREYAPYVTQ
jgi:hypothetical protein